RLGGFRGMFLRSCGQLLPAHRDDAMKEVICRWHRHQRRAQCLPVMMSSITISLATAESTKRAAHRQLFLLFFADSLLLLRRLKPLVDFFPVHGIPPCGEV